MYTQLKRYDRIQLEAYLRAKMPPKQIAKIMKRHISTIYREIKRGQYLHLNSDYTTEKRYSYNKAQQRADFEQAAKGSDLKIGNDYAFVAYIENQIINEKNSPAVALANIRRQNLQFRTKITIRTLYSYIDKGIFPHITNKDLYYRGKRKRKYRRTKAKTAPRGKSIEIRPKEAQTRTSFGHWELDSIIGTAERGATVLNLTERKTRMMITYRTKSKEAAETVKFLNSIERRYGKHFRTIFKTITVDNGTEFAYTEVMENSPYTHQQRTEVYYCHPYCSSERGTNENHNRLLRRFIPKGVSINRYTQADIQKITEKLNNYPRAILDWQTPAELFASELSKLGITSP